MTHSWSVAADDRTGALEVGGLVAATFGPVTVSTGAVVGESGVVDLGTRVMSAERAASTVAAFDAASSSRHRLHKMDSTLRGNWAAELIARAAATERRVVLLPGWPQVGRTCVGGVVHVHGAPIGAVRDQLPAATIVHDVEGLRAWIGRDRAGERFVSCDIRSTEQMVAAAQALIDSECLIAGPAGPLAAVLAAQFSHHAASPQRPPVSARSAMVVCGSANPVAVAQVERVRVSLPDVRVLATPPADGDLSIDAARRLASDARSSLVERPADVVVIVGGDTAAAFLGDGPRVACGMAAPGMPWSLGAEGEGPVVVTKAGGFGTPDALVHLLSGENV